MSQVEVLEEHQRPGYLPPAILSFGDYLNSRYETSEFVGGQVFIETSSDGEYYWFDTATGVEIVEEELDAFIESVSYFYDVEFVLYDMESWYTTDYLNGLLRQQGVDEL